MESLQSVLLDRANPHIVRQIWLPLSYGDVLACLRISRRCSEVIKQQLLQDRRLTKRLMSTRVDYFWTTPGCSFEEMEWSLDVSSIDAPLDFVPARFGKRFSIVGTAAAPFRKFIFGPDGNMRGELPDLPPDEDYRIAHVTKTRIVCAKPQEEEDGNTNPLLLVYDKGTLDKLRAEPCNQSVSHLTSQYYAKLSDDKTRVQIIQYDCVAMKFEDRHSFSVAHLHGFAGPRWHTRLDRWDTGDDLYVTVYTEKLDDPAVYVLSVHTSEKTLWSKDLHPDVSLVWVASTAVVLRNEVRRQLILWDLQSGCQMSVLDDKVAAGTAVGVLSLIKRQESICVIKPEKGPQLQVRIIDTNLGETAVVVLPAGTDADLGGGGGWDRVTVLDDASDLFSMRRGNLAAVFRVRQAETAPLRLVELPFDDVQLISDGLLGYDRAAGRIRHMRLRGPE